MAYNPNDFMDPKKFKDYSSKQYKDRTKSKKQVPNKTKKDDDDKRNSKMAIYVILAVIIIILLLLLRSCACSNGDLQNEINPTGDGTGSVPTDVTTTPSGGIIWDDGAQDMEYTTRDPEQIQEELNKKLEASMMTISMSSYVVYEDGTSQGLINFINVVENNYPQRVEFIRNDTGECIYKSGAVAVGQGIQYNTLDVDLDAGTYECTVYFYALDPNTGDTVGSAGAVIDILVKN